MKKIIKKQYASLVSLILSPLSSVVFFWLALYSLSFLNNQSLTDVIFKLTGNYSTSFNISYGFFNALSIVLYYLSIILPFVLVIISAYSAIKYLKTQQEQVKNWRMINIISLTLSICLFLIYVVMLFI